jgi:hypothetical protein
MQTEPANEHEATAEHLRRLLEQLETLGARITRLAEILRVPLQTREDVDHVLLRSAEPAALHGREAGMREELRGLLVLRYEIITHLVASVGAQAARDILLSAQDRLLREGFAPRAPGMDLHPLFDGL